MKLVLDVGGYRHHDLWSVHVLPSMALCREDRINRSRFDYG
jgi:hypothetical protein